MFIKEINLENDDWFTKMIFIFYEVIPNQYVSYLTKHVGK